MNWIKLLKEIKLNIEVCIEYIALAGMLVALGSYSIVIICCTFIFNWLDQLLKLLRIRK